MLIYAWMAHSPSSLPAWIGESIWSVFSFGDLSFNNLGINPCKASGKYPLLLHCPLPYPSGCVHLGWAASKLQLPPGLKEVWHSGIWTLMSELLGEVRGLYPLFCHPWLCYLIHVWVIADGWIAHLTLTNSDHWYWQGERASHSRGGGECRAVSRWVNQSWDGSVATLTQLWDFLQGIHPGLCAALCRRLMQRQD